MDNIAFAVHKYLGLSETFIYEPLRSIKSFNVSVLTLDKENLNTFPHPSVFSVSDLPFYAKFREKLTNNFGRFNFFEYVIKRKKIKLIHAHFGWEGIFILNLSQKLKIPLITSLYGSDINRWPKNNFYRKQLKSLFDKGDLFIAACEDLRIKAIALGCPQHKIITEHCGIDLNKFSPPKNKIKRKTINILMCGRLVDYKGFALALEAFSRCFNNHRNIRMQIIGNGVIKNDLEKLISKFHLNDYITLQGGKNHADVSSAMRESDIFVMPYFIGKHGECEAAPLVLKEAQAVAIPVISTYLGGVPEIIVDGQTGFLIQQKDTANLIIKLNQLIENPRLRIELGTKGRIRVEKYFNLENQTHKLENIYDKLIRGERGN